MSLSKKVRSQEYPRRSLCLLMPQTMTGWHVRPKCSFAARCPKVRFRERAKRWREVLISSVWRHQYMRYNGYMGIAGPRDIPAVHFLLTRRRDTVSTPFPKQLESKGCKRAYVAFVSSLEGIPGMMEVIVQRRVLRCVIPFAAIFGHRRYSGSPQPRTNTMWWVRLQWGGGQDFALVFCSL